MRHVLLLAGSGQGGSLNSAPSPSLREKSRTTTLRAHRLDGPVSGVPALSTYRALLGALSPICHGPPRTTAGLIHGLSDARLAVVVLLIRWALVAMPERALGNSSLPLVQR